MYAFALDMLYSGYENNQYNSNFHYIKFGI